MTLASAQLWEGKAGYMPSRQMAGAVKGEWISHVARRETREQERVRLILPYLVLLSRMNWSSVRTFLVPSRKQCLWGPSRLSPRPTYTCSIISMEQSWGPSHLYMNPCGTNQIQAVARTESPITLDLLLVYESQVHIQLVCPSVHGHPFSFKTPGVSQLCNFLLCQVIIIKLGFIW